MHCPSFPVNGSQVVQRECINIDGTNYLSASTLYYRVPPTVFLKVRFTPLVLTVRGTAATC